MDQEKMVLKNERPQYKLGQDRRPNLPMEMILNFPNAVIF